MANGNDDTVTYRCPVCGYPDQIEADLDTQWQALVSSYDICSCCGTEFGLDVRGASLEAVKQSIHRRRAEWISEGHPWFFKQESPPKSWDWRAQLRTIGVDVDEDNTVAEVDD